MLVGNKSDLDNVGERMMSPQEGRALADELRCGFVEVSAKTGEGVQEAFEELVRAVRRCRVAALAASGAVNHCGNDEGEMIGGDMIKKISVPIIKRLFCCW